MQIRERSARLDCHGRRVSASKANTALRADRLPSCVCLLLASPPSRTAAQGRIGRRFLPSS